LFYEIHNYSIMREDVIIGSIISKRYNINTWLINQLDHDSFHLNYSNAPLNKRESQGVIVVYCQVSNFSATVYDDENKLIFNEMMMKSALY
jgi:hypothetical protein